MSKNKKGYFPEFFLHYSNYATILVIFHEVINLINYIEYDELRVNFDVSNLKF